MDNIKKISPDAPDPGIIKLAGDIIKNGGSVVFPTSCLYGLGVDAFNRDAVKSLFNIKRRSPEKPVSLMVDKKFDLTGIVQNIPDSGLLIMERFWPGKVTIVFAAKKLVSVDLTAGTGKIGIRAPAHRGAAAFVSAAGRPVTGTSANISGCGGCSDINQLDPKIAQQVDLILDAGPLIGGSGSTVVDVTVDPPKILREGSHNLMINT
jgi:L-threonylcarbamoyladenylate synthase